MPEFNPEKHYWGKPCKWGHEGIRLKSTRTCVICNNTHSKRWYQNNPNNIWAKRHPEKAKNHKRQYHLANKKRLNEKSRQWRINNPYKHQEMKAQWDRDNPEKRRFYTRKRKTKKQSAIPPWFEEERVQVVYTKATSLGGHVDHIVPITSDIVCGLHCWDNLQVLSLEQNSAKGNRVWPDMPGEET